LGQGSYFPKGKQNPDPRGGRLFVGDVVDVVVFVKGYRYVFVC
jgi:hypothetical protein